MKKLSLGIFIGLIIGAIVSPIVGMAIGSTRSLILGLAPNEAILTLADKIDAESGRNDVQEETISKLNISNEEQKAQLEGLAKQQEISACNEKRSSCELKINAIGKDGITLTNGTISTGDRQEAIQKIEAAIKSCKKDRDSGEFKSDAIKEAWERCINNGEKDIAKIKSIMVSEALVRSDLLDGECKEYKDICG